MIENPAGSLPSLAFMLATVSAFGEDRWLGFWADPKKNGVEAVEDGSTAYYTEFSASSAKGPLTEGVFANSPIG